MINEVYFREGGFINDGKKKKRKINRLEILEPYILLILDIILLKDFKMPRRKKVNSA